MKDVICLLGNLMSATWRVLVVAVLLLLAAVAMLGFTAYGSRIVADKVAALVSAPGQIVAIETPTGLLTGGLRVPRITLADEKGIYASISGLSIDWSPASLLTGTFHARRISADKVDFIRPPEKPAADDAASGPFQLPIAVKIDDIALADVEIGPQAAGRQFRLVASGSGMADGNGITASLAASRMDNPEAKASADLVFVPGENRLTLKADVDEPRDGMLAGLMNLPDRPAIHLSLIGEGPLSDWSGRLLAALDGKTAASMEARHKGLPADGHQIILKGEGEFQPLMPATVRDFFAGSTRFDFDVSTDTTGRVSVQSGNLGTSSLAMSIAGTYDPAGENNLTARIQGVSGPVALQVPAGKAMARVLLRDLSLALSGPADHAVLKATAAVDSADYPEYRIEGVSLSAQSDALDLRTRTGLVNVVLTAEKTAFANENLQRLLPGPFELKAPVSMAPDAFSFDDATIESARLGGSVSGKFARGDQAFDGTVRLFVLPAALPAQFASKSKGTIALSGAVSARADGAVNVSGLKLVSDLLDVSGDVQLADGKIKTDLVGNLPELGAFLADARGKAAFTFSAEGDIRRPAFKATANSGGAQLSGRKLERLAVTAEGTADVSAPSAAISAEGRLSGQDITIQAEVRSENGVTSLPVLKADIGRNHLEGALRVGPALLPEGGVSFDMPDLGLVAALAGQKASGDIKGKIQFTEKDGIGAARIEAGGSVIARDGITVRQPTVSLDISDIKTLAASGILKTAEVSSGANRLINPVLGFSRDGADTRFDLKANYDGKPLTVAGAVRVADGQTAIHLEQLAAQPRGIALKLAKAADVTVRDGKATLSGIVIQAGKGSVSVSGSAGSTLDISAVIQALPLNLLNAVQPSLKAEGTASGKVHVTGTPAAPKVDFNVALDRLAVDQTRAARLQPFAIKADGRFENNRVQLKTSATNGDGLSIKGGGTASVAGNRALDLSFDGTLPFKAVSAMLAAQGIEIGGTASLKVKIAGTATAPSITGQISSTNAQLVDVRHNIALKNLALSVDLDKTRATISKLSGTLSTGGTISATGTVGIAPGSGFPADIAINLDRAAYVDGKIVSTVIDGKLSLTGPVLINPKLGGKLALGRSAITIPQKLPASLSEINVKHRNENRAVAAQAADVMSRKGSGKGSSSDIALDLTISAPRIFVQGRGIDAELGGDLTVQGTAADPVVSGGFKMKRGRLTILNRRLDFTAGTITFGGDMTPTLGMAAEADSGSVTVTVNIDGPANDPAVSFSSSPSLPQDEILAQLIFQQSLSRLSVLQIAQLADAAAQLAGGRSTSLFQSLRSNLGIDDLDVTSDENGQAQVKAGKYLNDKTYIQIEQGAGSGGKASINLDVGRGFKLKGEAGSDGGGAAGIFYEKEY